LVLQVPLLVRAVADLADMDNGRNSGYERALCYTKPAS
jgi:hypothetical protein